MFFAIADAGSEEWAKAARDAAIELSHGQDEDLGVQLLLERYKKYENRTPMPPYLMSRFAAIVRQSITYVLTGVGPKSEALGRRKTKRQSGAAR